MNSIALLGQPNSGKSTIYNNLTGSRQHVGNWAGKTVEKNEGSYTYQGTAYTVTDLPGSYGLSGNSDEEIITTDFIRSGQSDLTVVLVDASQLERSMFMLAEFARLEKPAVLVLNMMDVAQGMGKKVDADAAQKQYNVNALAEPRNVILKDDPTVVIQPAHELPHDRDFALPRFARRCACIAVVMIAQQSEDSVLIFTQEIRKAVMIQTARAIIHCGHLLSQCVMYSVAQFGTEIKCDSAQLIQSSSDCGS